MNGVAVQDGQIADGAPQGDPTGGAAKGWQRFHLGKNTPRRASGLKAKCLRREYLSQDETATHQVTFARVLYSGRSQRLFCMMSAMMATCLLYTSRCV